MSIESVEDEDAVLKSEALRLNVEMKRFQYEEMKKKAAADEAERVKKAAADEITMKERESLLETQAILRREREEILLQTILARKEREMYLQQK